MIHKIRLEVVNRVMGFFIRNSKGDKYIQKLETAFKNTLVGLFFLLIFIVNITTKYIQLYIYSNDADHVYQLLMKKEKHVASELEKTLAFSREQFNYAQTLRKENYDLIKKIDTLKEENAELKVKNAKCE